MGDYITFLSAVKKKMPDLSHLREEQLIFAHGFRGLYSIVSGKVWRWGHCGHLHGTMKQLALLWQAVENGIDMARLQPPTHRLVPSVSPLPIRSHVLSPKTVSSSRYQNNEHMSQWGILVTIHIQNIQGW